jgi:hypothetical protein
MFCAIKKEKRKKKKYLFKEASYLVHKVQTIITTSDKKLKGHKQVLVATH